MEKGIKNRLSAALLAATCAVSVVPAGMGASAEDGAVIYETGFEDGVIEFTGRGGVEVIEAVDTSAHTGDYSMCVSGREKSWNGPQLLLDERCEAGVEYMVSAWVRAEWYNDIKLSMEYTDTEGTRHYSNLNSAVSQGEWVEITATKFSFTSDVTNVYIYFESGDTANIYVDDFVLEEAPIIPIQEDIPSLKNVYADHFKVGTAICASNLASPSYMDLVEKHFSDSITFGNELKPDSVLDQNATLAYVEENGDDTNPQVTLSAAKSLLDYCGKNNIPVRGHVLVWHSQTPDWFFKEGFTDEGDWVSKEKMLVRMENYIKNVMEKLATDYPDVEFYAWDVVNEAWTDDGKPRTAGSNNTSSGQSAWVQVFGDNSFIEPAFEYARKYAPEGCKLYYNDYNEYIQGKRNAIYDMALDLKEKGLIDGIGMQAHLDVSFPTASVFEAALSKFASTGLDVQITELDATTSDTSEAGFETQAQYYSDIFDAIVKYSDSVSAVVLWGVTDDTSWRATKCPLLFDAQFQAKPAFYSIIDGIEYTEPVPVPGDANLNGSVTIADIVLVQKHILTEKELTVAQAEYADMNADGAINVFDVALIKQILLA
ncbi:MAG: endo-1,4-beta-xylanase [Ruminococcus sp.]|nr:endo-1,4-beta-xylanase [Ruminococcus sp.]